MNDVNVFFCILYTYTGRWNFDLKLLKVDGLGWYDDYRN